MWPPSFRDDPAWREYEHDLKFLAILDRQRQQREALQEFTAALTKFAEAMVPRMRALNEAFARAAEAYRPLLEHLEGLER